MLAHTNSLHATRCDAKPVLDNIPGRRRKQQYIHKDHHFLLQCIDEAIHRGSPVPYHVRSHADYRKPARDARGRLGAGCTDDDWGNYIADRVAIEAQDDLTFHGIQYVEITITATDLYNSLGFSGQWYASKSDRRPIEASGVAEHVGMHRARQ